MRALGEADPGHVGPLAFVAVPQREPAPELVDAMEHHDGHGTFPFDKSGKAFYVINFHMRSLKGCKIMTMVKI